MKKIFNILGAAFLMVAVSACSGNQKSDGNKATAMGDREEMYTGVLPAADTDGIRYSLKLDYDDDHNYTDGDYDLVETFFMEDSTVNGGYRDIKTFKSEGDFNVVNKDGKSYLKLVQDRDDSDKGSSDGPLYFLVESDSTLIMVNSDMELPEHPNYYTLRLVK